MPTQIFFPFVIALFSGAFVIQLMLWNYRFAEQRAHWIAVWDVTPEKLGGAGYGRLAIASLLALFLELTMIRWVSSEVRIFAYFKNFVLIACLLGFGLGCYFSRRAINGMAVIAPLFLLVAMASSPWTSMHLLVVALPGWLGGGSQVHMWGLPAISMGWCALPAHIAALLITAILFFLVTLSLMPIGQMVGWYQAPSAARRLLKPDGILIIRSSLMIAALLYLASALALKSAKPEFRARSAAG